jgi:hypothetical protein
MTLSIIIECCLALSSMLAVVHAECCKFVLMLSVIVLNVIC